MRACILILLVACVCTVHSLEHFLTVPLGASALFNVTDAEFYAGVLQRIAIPGGDSEVLVVEESWRFFRERPANKRREAGSPHFVPFENKRVSIQDLSVEDYLESLIESVTNSWALDRIDQALKPLDNSYLGYADGISNLRGVHIYVIDTGVFAHSDIPGTVTLDFDRYSANVAWDCNGHGTHVAGLIASNTYGVSPSAAHHIHGIRVLDCTGSGTSADVIAGLLYVQANMQLPAVINMSLGIKGTTSSLTSAVTGLINSGAVVVGAGGNQADNACNYFPAVIPGVVGVGALDRTSDNLDVSAYYSNYGSCLAIYAPGSEVTSTLPNNLVGTKSGTSMASPIVAGAIVAALASDLTLTGPSAKTLVLGRATMHIVTGTNVGSLRNNILFVPPALAPPPPAPATVSTTAAAAATTAAAAAVSTSVAATSRGTTTSVASTTGRTSTTAAAVVASTTGRTSTTAASTVGVSTLASTTRAATATATSTRTTSTRAATTAATATSTAHATSTASTRATSTARATSTGATTAAAAATRGTTTRASTTAHASTSTSARATTTAHTATTTSARTTSTRATTSRASTSRATTSAATTSRASTTRGTTTRATTTRAASSRQPVM